MPTATLTSKGQITIPRQVREAMGLVVGDRVTFLRMEDGCFAVVPASAPIRALKGIVPRPERAVSLAEMEAAIAAGALSR